MQSGHCPVFPPEHQRSHEALLHPGSDRDGQVHYAGIHDSPVHPGRARLSGHRSTRGSGGAHPGQDPQGAQPGGGLLQQPGFGQSSGLAGLHQSPTGSL